MFRRFRNYTQIGGKKSLPYDAEVSYLESTGSQWINTLLSVSNQNLSATIDFQFTRQTSEVSSNGNVVFGTYGSGAICTFGIYAGNWRIRTPSVFDGTASGFNLSRHTVNFNFSTGTEIDGNKVANGGSKITNTALIALFSRGYNSTSANALSACMIYSCKIFVEATIVRDFIPVRFTNELGVSEGAMYDKVSGQLFRNAGAGAFVVGPDKKTTIPWIKFDGASAIILGGRPQTGINQ